MVLVRKMIINSGFRLMNKITLVCWEGRWFMSGELLTLIATMAIITIDRFNSKIARVTGRTLNGNGDS